VTSTQRVVQVAKTDGVLSTGSSASSSDQLSQVLAHTTTSSKSTKCQMNCSLRISMSVEIPLTNYMSVWRFRVRHRMVLVMARLHVHWHLYSVASHCTALSWDIKRWRDTCMTIGRA